MKKNKISKSKLTYIATLFVLLIITTPDFVSSKYFDEGIAQFFLILWIGFMIIAFVFFLIFIFFWQREDTYNASSALDISSKCVMATFILPIIIMLLCI